MAIKIGSNISSLKAQRSLSVNTEKVSSVFERLSSGQRINKASDDAAGLAIADSLRAKSKVFTQAIRNINDGSSYLSIAEGAIDQLKTILLRTRELSTQASNGSYSDKQRSALDNEAQALASEYNRIIDTTSFNGRKVFELKNGQLSIQAGFGEEAILST